MAAKHGNYGWYTLNSGCQIHLEESLKLDRTCQHVLKYLLYADFRGVPEVVYSLLLTIAQILNLHLIYSDYFEDFHPKIMTYLTHLRKSRVLIDYPTTDREQIKGKPE